jgi:hypothetical protein
LKGGSGKFTVADGVSFGVLAQQDKIGPELDIPGIGTFRFLAVAKWLAFHNAT